MFFFFYSNQWFDNQNSSSNMISANKAILRHIHKIFMYAKSYLKTEEILATWDSQVCFEC